jgi:hypothetical protein
MIVNQYFAYLRSKSFFNSIGHERRTKHVLATGAWPQAPYGVAGNAPTNVEMHRVRQTWRGATAPKLGRLGRPMGAHASQPNGARAKDPLDARSWKSSFDARLAPRDVLHIRQQAFPNSTTQCF